MDSNEVALNAVGESVQMSSNELNSAFDAVPDLVGNRMHFTPDLSTGRRMNISAFKNRFTTPKGRIAAGLLEATDPLTGMTDFRTWMDEIFVHGLHGELLRARNKDVTSDRVSTTLAVPLHARLTAALKEGSSLAGKTSHFLPRSELDRLINRETVAAEPTKARVSIDDAQRRLVYTDYRKIFATLVMASQPSAILEFVRCRVDDRRLPLPYRARDEIVGMTNDQETQLHSLFTALEANTAEEFLKWQHVINPPQLQLAWNCATQERPHASFHEQAVLPFTHVEQSNSGGYGTIFRVRIHPDHHRGYQPAQEEPWLAIKKLRSPDEKGFAQEVNVLRKLSQASHPNIVPFLGSFQLGQGYHLIFPWADSDLSTFWRLNPKPNADEETGAWVMSQLSGLVDALTFLHGSDSNVIRGAHNDLKPSNILCFKDKGNLGEHQRHSIICKLADFGSAHLWEPGVRPAQLNDMPRTTPVYRAPEWDLEPQRISRAYDIWSLGCIFLEFATWMVHGSAGLDKLAALRWDSQPNDPSRDAFFHYVENIPGQLEPKLKPGVMEVSPRYSFSSFQRRLTHVE